MKHLLFLAVVLSGPAYVHATQPDIILAACTTLTGLAEESADIVVYDSTPAGYSAAIAAAREGASVILLEPTDHVGGVNTGGLSLSDSFGCLRESLGGLWREWHERIAADYAARGVKLPYQVDDTNEVRWTYEPHVAMRVTRAMLDEAKVTVLTGRSLRAVRKDGTQITTLVTTNGSFTGKVFIDASYEGDLMAAAGVSWTIGREGRDEFNESQAGVNHGQKKPTAKISGFGGDGKPLSLITGTELPPRGTADGRLQVYSFRLCLTRNPDNRVPMPAPANYDPARWELARRLLAVQGHKGVGFDTYPLPNGKFDGNDSIGRLLSLGLVGGAQGWCEADEAGRQAIWKAHKQYTLELFHFLTTDPSVPESIRNHYAGLGLCKDEFAEYGHFSPELYVREGRRMKGEYFMTQNDIDKNPAKDDPVGVSSFPADSHDVTRVALKEGGVVTEGAFLHWYPGKRHGYPYHVPYRALTPKKNECGNLLVPVAFSGTHVVICSARVEPTWMTLGHSAGIAAAMAAMRGIDVQDLPYDDLARRLEAQGQRLALPKILNAPTAAKPNIVFIIADDLGYGDLGCYGQKTIQTPVLDTLASEGIRFTQHYSGSTVCAPSRSALMTGLDTGCTWLRGNGEFALRPDPEDLTVATLLKGAGYRTAMIGKSCVTGNTQTPELVLDKGFDVFYGTTDHRDGHFRYPLFVYDQTEQADLEGNDLHTGMSYDAELYTARAERFIRESDSPFFLLLSYPIPHAAVLGPKGSVPGSVGRAPKKGRYTEVDDPAAEYRAMVEAIDGYVGRVLAALKAKGVADDTLLIFTSDNGPHYEGGYNPTMLDSSGPLRGGKRDLYEGGIRVPMIAWWPAGITKPGTSDHISAFWDFLPTACDIAGVDAPEGIDGISWLSTLTGKEKQAEHDFLYWEFHEAGTRRALRQGDWKLVQYDVSKKGKPMLFHLGRDLAETNDLASEEPERVAAMLELMDKHRTPSPIFPNAALDRR